MDSNVSITVSGPLALRVAEYLNSLPAEDAVGEPTSPGEGTVRTPGRDRPWIKTEITNLKRSINDTGRAAMDLGSAQAAKWVSFTEVAEAAGQSRASARAGLAGLTRHIKSRYSHSEWPIEVVWGSNIGLSDEMHYRVNAEVAQWWNEADEPA